MPAIDKISRFESAQSELLLDEKAAERISALLEGVGSAFEQQDGPFLECFSAEKVVNMFFTGASELEFDHVMACEFCYRRTQRYAQLTRRQLDRTRQAASSVFTRFRDWIGFETKSPFETPSALLRLPQSIIQVSGKTMALEASFACDMISGFDLCHLPEVNTSSLTLGGPVTGSRAQIESVDIKGKEVLRIMFEDARLADYVVRDLQNHARVSGTIFLKGAFADPGVPGFLARATVSIVQEREK
jgi:hypothetical protein